MLSVCLQFLCFDVLHCSVIIAIPSSSVLISGEDTSFIAVHV